MTVPREVPPSLGDSIMRIVRKRLPWIFYTGLHSFRVAKVTAGRVDLEPSGARTFKAQRAVYQWPGVSGAEAVPAVGSEVLLVFIDHDPNRPALVSFQPLRVDNGKPSTVTLDATGTIDIGAHASEVHVKTDLEVDGGALVAGTSYLGGLSASSLAHAQEIITWAALAVISVNQCATYINGIVPLSVVPLAPLAGTVTAAKAKGV